MTTQERAMEVAKLRLRFQMNGRLRLESLAALSKVFREYNEPIREELLGSIVFAVPEELLGPADPNMQAQFSETYRLTNAPAYPPPAFPTPATPGNKPPLAPATPGNKPPLAPATPGGGKPPAGGAPATPGGGKPPAGGAPATPGGHPPARPKGSR
jgi:hypothetical protein